MEAVVLLCDHAEAVNGKLYIMGGGWSELRGPNPFNCAVAVQLATAWNETNERHEIAVRLVTEDGQPALDLRGQQVAFAGEYEVGRPPGSVPGNDVVSTFAFQFAALTVDSGGYRFACCVDDDEVAAARFRVVRPPGWTVQAE